MTTSSEQQRTKTNTDSQQPIPDNRNKATSNQQQRMTANTDNQQPIPDNRLDDNQQPTKANDSKH
jgi:hypothetical protein